MKTFVQFLLTGVLCLMALPVGGVEIPCRRGTLRVDFLTDRAVRLRYVEQTASPLPELVYVPTASVGCRVSRKAAGTTLIRSRAMQLRVDGRRGRIVVEDRRGRRITLVEQLSLTPGRVGGEPVCEARLSLHSPAGERLYGLGQFQDGYADLRGLSRRLTQVNTQIAIPMLISSKGYGLLWNNCGLTDFNPGSQQVELRPAGAGVAAERVNVTSAEGGREELRRQHVYHGELTVGRPGRYALLLDVGQKMARAHDLTVDGQTVISMHNLWLPPTASAIVSLTAGRHTLSARLSEGDRPVVICRPVDCPGPDGRPHAVTELRSPVAQAVDFTLFVGSADEVVAACHAVTGRAPLMPKWALGYVHCRERFHSQAEIMDVARGFRRRRLPVDVMVQDWQYWGRYGWNAMRFDEAQYPDPKGMVDSLHRLGMRFMVSVWSKIDSVSDVGRAMGRAGHYIPGTQWIDFFKPEAARAYWDSLYRRMVGPCRIDGLWQDATEPENDDLAGRRVMGGRYAGEWLRNVYPLLVNRTIYEGLCRDVPGKRHLILTRSGFSGIQRYGALMWSGDVGNDWETLRRQFCGGMGMAAAGMPWWTYDAGGFFRPAGQYTDSAYIERMLRWVQAAVFLPVMRVHGYMSDTEPWHYGPEAERLLADCLRLRYRLLPYVYAQAAAVTREGRMMMRPMVFDFADDSLALAHADRQYMFGPSLLVSPVTRPGVDRWTVALPANRGGWYDFFTGRHYDGGRTVDIPVTRGRIPVLARAGSMVPLGPAVESTAAAAPDSLELRIYPGADARFTLYDDDGRTCDYEHGACCQTELVWNDHLRRLTIGPRRGRYAGMPERLTLRVSVGGRSWTVAYDGRAQVLVLK